jgi:hypothetical protein
MDEIWIHHYTPESKQQSKQWTEAGCSAPKKARSVPSAGKVMASVIWDAEGILFIDYLEKGKTITREYSNLLTRLDEKIHGKRPGLQKKTSSFIRTMHLPTKVFWQWENEGICTMNCWNIHHIPQIWLPPDFFLFPKLKLFFTGQRFSSNQEAIAAIEEYFGDLTKNHYRDGIMALEHGWSKCISLKEDYVEK